MKIAIIQGPCLPIPPLKGGAVEKMWYALGQKFAEFNHEVVHISRQWEDLPAHEIVNGVQYIRIKGFDLRMNVLILKALDALYTTKAIRKLHYDTDIVVTNTFWAPIIIPFFRKAKIYVDVARMPKGQMRLYHKATRLRANSTAVVNAILTELPMRRHGQVIMIPNPLPFVSSKQINAQKKEPIVLYCGRIHPEKGLNLLSLTAARLPKGWSMKIVGPWKIEEGGGGEQYVEFLQQCFAGTPVDFIKPIYDLEKLNDLYRMASVFVYPSIAEKGETFGLAPLEAMSFGCVPVVSDLACFKDFIIDGENGLMFDHRSVDAPKKISDRILKLIKDDVLRKQMMESAWRVNASHSIERVAALLLEDFCRI